MYIYLFIIVFLGDTLNWTFNIFCNLYEFLLKYEFYKAFHVKELIYIIVNKWIYI